MGSGLPPFLSLGNQLQQPFPSLVGCLIRQTPPVPGRLVTAHIPSWINRNLRPARLNRPKPASGAAVRAVPLRWWDRNQNSAVAIPGHPHPKHMEDLTTKTAESHCQPECRVNNPACDPALGLTALPWQLAQQCRHSFCPFPSSLSHSPLCCHLSPEPSYRPSAIAFPFRDLLQ